MTQSPQYHDLELDGTIYRREDGPLAELLRELRKERFKDFASLPKPRKPTLANVAAQASKAAIAAAADCFAVARFVPSEAEIAEEFLALAASLPADAEYSPPTRRRRSPRASRRPTGCAHPRKPQHVLVSRSRRCASTSPRAR